MRYKGGVISATAPTTSTSTAKGIWTAEQQFQSVGASVWPRSPGAPTIGTATAVTYQTATVAFTAPSDTGSGGITGYTATSSPSSLTGTGTSPITVSGLSGSTSYTFTVVASTPGGTGPASAASNSITTAAAPINFMVQMTPASEATRQFNLVDSSGNIYLFTLQNGVGDTFVSYTPSGSLVYKKSFVSGGFNTITSVYYNGTNIYGGSTRDWTVLNTSGTVLAQYRLAISGYTVSGNQFPRMVADTAGNIYGASYWTDGATEYPVVIKINSSGTAQWAKQLSTGLTVNPKNLYIDGSSNVFVYASNDNSGFAILGKLDSSGANVALTNNRIQLNGTYAHNGGFEPVNSKHYIVGQNSGATTCAFIAQFDSTGTYQWMQGLYIGVTAQFRSLAFDSAGNIYVLGSRTSSTESLIAKYDSSGNLQWQRLLATNTAYQLVARYSITISGDKMIISGNYASEDLYTVAFILPTDGSLQGTLTCGSISAIYSNGSGSSSALSPTVTSLSLSPSALTLSTSNQSASTQTSTLGLTTATL